MFDIGARLVINAGDTIWHGEIGKVTGIDRRKGRVYYVLEMEDYVGVTVSFQRHNLSEVSR